MKKTRHSKGQIRLIVLLGLILMINFFLFYWNGFPGSLAAITGNLPVNQVPDVNLSFSPDLIYIFLTNIGVEGRDAFRVMHLTVDLTFPFVYSLFFYLLIRFLLDKLKTNMKWLPFLPLLAGVFDLTENFILNYLTRAYPAYYPNLALIVELLTMIKFALIAISFITVLFLTLKLFRKSTA
jgi:hypothetical protein